MRGLSDQEMAALTPAERSEPRTPLPVRMVSSEEYRPRYSFMPWPMRWLRGWA